MLTSDSTLSGTLFIYEGQELGMVNVPKEWPMDEYKDVEALNYYRMVEERSQGDPKALEKAKAAIQNLGRDNARTPMQWNSQVNAGFTEEGVTPWMRANSSAKVINVADQMARKDSCLAFWRQVLRLRQEHPKLFVFGDFELVDDANEQVFSFVKRSRNATALVTCNFSGEAAPSPVSGLTATGKLLLSNVSNPSHDVLQPWEGQAYVLQDF